MKYKIVIEYDGTQYVGWQCQKDRPEKSIEMIIQNALFKMTGESVKINGSGRTDAGVHAISQIADFSIEARIEPFKIVDGLNNYLLSTDISILNCEIVDDDFHSRFDAKMRHYRYCIINRRAPLSLSRNRAWHVAKILDINSMKFSANKLIGTHDFSAFRDSECQSKTPVKTIKNISITQDGQMIFIDISAKSFLHHMVRNIVGTLVWIGTGKIGKDEIEEILLSKKRCNSGPNAPACGLYFVGVDYI